MCLQCNIGTRHTRTEDNRDVIGQQQQQHYIADVIITTVNSPHHCKLNALNISIYGLLNG